MKRGNEAFSLNEKRTGVIVIGLLLFIAVVMIIGSVGSVMGQGPMPLNLVDYKPSSSSTIDYSDPAYWPTTFEGITPEFRTYISTVGVTTDNRESQVRFVEYLKSFKNNEDFLNNFWNQLSQTQRDDLWKHLSFSTNIRDGDPLVHPAGDLFNKLDKNNRLNIWDKTSWKDSFALYFNLDNGQRASLWNELREGKADETGRENQLPRNLEFLQGALTGKKLSGDSFDDDKVTQEYLTILPIERLVSSAVNDALNANSPNAYENLMKFINKLYSPELKAKGIDGNVMMKKFLDNIPNGINGETPLKQKERLITRMFEDKTNPLSKTNVYRIFNALDVKDKLRAFIASKIMNEASMVKGRFGNGYITNSDGREGKEKIEIKDIKGLEFVDKIENGKFVLKNGKKVDPEEVSVFADAMEFSAKGVSYQIKDGDKRYVINDFSVNSFVDHYNRFYSVDGEGKRTLLGITDSSGMEGSKITFEDVKDSKGVVTGQKVSLENPTKVSGNDLKSWKVYFLGSDNRYYTVADGKQTGNVVFTSGKPTDTDLGMITMSNDFFAKSKEYYEVADEQRTKTLAATSPVPAPVTSSTPDNYNTRLTELEKTTKSGTGVIYATGDKMNSQGFTANEAKPSSDGKSVRSVSVEVKDQSDVSLVQYEGVHVASVNVVNGKDVSYFGVANSVGGQPVFKIDGAEISSSTTGDGGEEISSSAEDSRLVQGTYDDGRTYSIINPKVQQAVADTNEQQGEPDVQPNIPLPDPTILSAEAPKPDDTKSGASKPGESKSPGSVSTAGSSGDGIAPQAPRSQGSVEIKPKPSETSSSEKKENYPLLNSDPQLKSLVGQIPQGKDKVILKLGRSMCGGCEEFTRNLPSYRRDYPNVHFVEIQRERNPDLYNKYVESFSAVPAFIQLNSNGQRENIPYDSFLMKYPLRN